MLIGRILEVDTLGAAIGSAVSPETDPATTRVLALVGQPGIGKTSLLAHARTLAHENKMLVLETTGVQTEQQIAFAGLGELLAPAIDLIDQLPKQQAEALAGSLAIGQPVVGGQLAVAAATLGVITRLAAKGPLLVVVDDAQWIDQPTESVLAYVARRLGSARVCFVVASRIEGQPAWLEQHHRINVSALGEADATSLLRSTAPDLSPSMRRAVLDASAGVPLALVEIPLDLDADERAGVRTPTRLLRPSTRVGELFERRVHQLPADSRIALLAAAVTSSQELAILEPTWEKLGVSLTDLVPAETLRLVSVDDERIRFVHPLVRNAAFHCAAEADRRAAHGALAGVVDAGARGWHLSASTVGPSIEVADALEATALDAFRKRAFLSTSTAYAESARRHLAPAERLRRWVAAADASQRAGDMRTALASFDSAKPELDLVSRPTNLAFMLSWATVLTHAGLLQQAVEVLAGIADDPDLHPDSSAFADALASYAHYVLGSVSPLLMLAERAEAKLTSCATAPVKAQTMIAVVRAASVLGEPERLRESLAVLDALVPELLSDHSRLVPQVMMLLAQHGPPDAVISRVSELIATEHEAGELNAIPFLLVAKSTALLSLGQWDQIETILLEAGVLATEAGLVNAATSAWFLAAHVPALRGEYERCNDMLDRMTAGSPGGRTGFADRSVAALNEFNSGKYAASAEAFRGYWANYRAGRLTNWASGRVTYGSDAVEALLVVGDRDGATEVAGDIRGRADLTRHPRELAEAFRVEGILGGAHGLTAAESFAEALKHEREQPYTFVRARILFGLGRSLCHDGKTVEAREALSLARDLFAELKAKGWIERTETELRAAGGRRRRGVEKISVLTVREAAIAAGIARGRTNREIAEELFVSPKTIEGHLSKVFAKLGVRNRTELSTLVLSDPSVIEVAKAEA